jgi:hypothetical protein
MSRVSRWEAIQKQMQARGLKLTSEQGRTTAAWLWQELDHAPPKQWDTSLSQVTERALRIFRAFMEEFEAIFLRETSCGEKWVRQFLRNRFGFAAEQAVEAVLNRIRDRRLHLLQAFRHKYQQELFGPWTFNEKRLRGYLKRVAWIESGKAPVAQLRQTIDTDSDTLDSWLPPAEDEPDLASYHQRAYQLAEFWSEAHGFSRAQQLEGLVSLGLGFATDSPILQQRCQHHLEEKYESWNTRWEQLQLRLAQLLERRAHLEGALPRLWDVAEKEAALEELERIRTRLARTRNRIQEHLQRLLPRPHEVQTILQGVVGRTVGTLRFQRIKREIQLLRERVEWGTRNLEKQFLAEIPKPLRQLLQDIPAHLQDWPPSPRQHGISPQERACRQEAAGCWHARGLEILTRVHRELNKLFREPPASGKLRLALRNWLSDVQDFYELGVLDRVGVVGGLQSRQGWRLERLLRSVIRD